MQTPVGRGVRGVKDLVDVRKLVLFFIPVCFTDPLYG